MPPFALRAKLLPPLFSGAASFLPSSCPLHRPHFFQCRSFLYHSLRPISEHLVSLIPSFPFSHFFFRRSSGRSHEFANFHDFTLSPSSPLCSALAPLSCFNVQFRLWDEIRGTVTSLIYSLGDCNRVVSSIIHEYAMLHRLSICKLKLVEDISII